MPENDAPDLRRRARRRRQAYVRALSPDQRSQLEHALAAHVVDALGPSGVMASYAATGSEISPHGIDGPAMASGWTLVFPRVIAPDEPLLFQEITRDGLIPGFQGIAEPPAEAPVRMPDVVLLPLLLADLTGNRLGQGGGHYDRTLAALRAKGRVMAVGLAWDVQIGISLSPMPWDEPLDALATPQGFHIFRRMARQTT